MDRRYFNTLTVKKDTQLLSTLIQQYEQGLQRENLGAQVEGFAPHFAVMTLTHNFLEKSKHGPAAVSDPNGDELICMPSPVSYPYIPHTLLTSIRYRPAEHMEERIGR